MMPLFKLTGKLVVVLLCILGSGIVHHALRELAAFPFNQINVVLIVVTFLLFFTRLPSALWYAFGVGYLLELYASTPFGVALFGILAGVLAGHVVFARWLTNFSLPSAVALLAVVAVVTRVGVLLPQLIPALTNHPVSLSKEAINLFFEILISAVVLACMYMIVRHTYRITRPEYVAR